MKRIITLLSAVTFTFSNAQTTADFESFSLPADSFYYSSTGADFQTTNAIFQYDWDSGFSYWSGGFSYTNKNDTTNGNFNNMYNCAAFKGYNNSNYYATGQANAIIKLKAPHNYVNGFYATNTTYAWKSMKNGDSFAKKFGGSSGNDPDWFKLIVKGYLGGVMKSDSAEFYLADYRFSNNSLDYIVKTWQWVNCSNLGVVDSIQILMNSSDVGSFGMNTPAYFSIDNFTTSQGVGINENSLATYFSAYPNPTEDNTTLMIGSNTAFSGSVKIFNTLGKIEKCETIQVASGMNTLSLDLSVLNSGIYFIELSDGQEARTFKLIKN
jgi:hypothetical protein